MNDTKITKKNLIGISLILILILVIFLRKNSRYNDMIKNKETTTAIITNYKFSNYSYTLYFEYYVNGVKYEKAIGTSFFTCDDGSRGCVGKKFKIIYSSKDPRNCEIDLGKFNKKKNIGL